MQDVFAINFDWKEGEQPTSAKLTGWVKQTDSAFSEITGALGDPWEYQSHIHPLSPEKLTQTSLARFLGPADWVSPQGASWSESCTANITLEANRNSWSLGFPLVSVSSPLSPQSSISSISELTWSSVSITQDPDNVLVTEKSSPEDVIADGDFHVDYNAGIITTYKITGSTVKLSVAGIYMFGAGVPWGTSNVIPTWNQIIGLVNVTENSGSPSGGLSTYTAALPTVTSGTRSTGSLSGSEGASYTNAAPGASTAKYRLPYVITSAFNGDPISGDEIPEGFILLWEDNASGTGIGRIVPNVTFYYVDEYTLKLVMVEGALSGNLGENYRLITTGTSISEAVNYLMNTVRSNNHSGITDGQDGKTLAYNNRISHSDLTNRFGGPISSPDVDISVNALKFRESAYPTNEHPQYLHRAGYMGEDENGNTANAMRGYLVFSAQDTFTLDLDTETYGIKWGDGGVSSPRMEFFGGSNSSTPIPFGAGEIGIQKDSAFDIYGSVAYCPYYNMPLYIRSSNSASYDSGASIAFDYANRLEMNYMKLLVVNRSGTYDPVNIPMKDSSITDSIWNSPIPETPDLSNRLNINQLREWRFRGVANVTGATNDGVTGHETYFTSPSVIGADMLNLYSNMIFFSDTGDGKVTSLHQKGPTWLANSSSRPTGLYYQPGTDNGGTLKFYAPNSTSSSTVNIFSFSRNLTTIGSWLGQTGWYNTFFQMNGNHEELENGILLQSYNASILVDAKYKTLLKGYSSTSYESSLELGGFGGVLLKSARSVQVLANLTRPSSIAISEGEVLIGGQHSMTLYVDSYENSYNRINFICHYDISGNDYYASSYIGYDKIYLMTKDNSSISGPVSTLTLDPNTTSSLLVAKGLNFYAYDGDINIKAYNARNLYIEVEDAGEIEIKSDKGLIEIKDETLIEHIGDVRLHPDSNSNGNGDIVLELNSANTSYLKISGLPTSIPSGSSDRVYIAEADLGDGIKKYLCIE